METKKSNNKLYIIIIILLAIICLLIGFIVGKDLLSTDNNNSEINENNNQNVNIEDKLEEKADEIVSLSSTESKPFLDKISIYNNYFVNSYSSNGITNASNDDLLYFLVIQLENFGDGYDRNGFTPDDLKKVANKYLPDDIRITYTDIHFPDDESTTLYKLGTDGKYTFIPVGRGGPGGYIMKEFYIDGYYNETKDIYTINTKLLFDTFCDGGCIGGVGSFYSDVALENIVYTNNSDYGMSLDSVYELVKDKLPITSYIFTKNNSENYVLSSVIVK